MFPEWMSDYGAFLRYIGRKPTAQHTIDRYPNNNGNYEPGNVRWADKKQQANNTRTCRYISAFGVTATLNEWADSTGLSTVLLHKRLRLGWDQERAVSTPVETADEKRRRAKLQADVKGGRIGVNA